MFYGSQQLRPSPLFTGESLHSPPQQFAPDNISTTNLPSVFVATSMKLFQQGLADPRGCEYQEIEVGTGSCWQGDAGVVKVHGWVIPTAPENHQSFAVSWNGLVYPVVAIGASADIRADILAAVKVNAEPSRCKLFGTSYYPSAFAISESDSISHQSLLLIKACLLLKLGEVELAEAIWTSFWCNTFDKADDDIKFKDPYLILANEWLWTLFDRAVCAHMRGDDKLALLSANLLLSIGDSVEEEAKRRGFEYPNFNQYRNGEPHYFRFLEQVPVLLADQQRRTKQPKRQQVLTAGLNKYPNKQQRISALIEDLEEVFILQGGQPSYPSLIRHPIIQGLVAEGEAAVEPLVACLETDTRLTRTIYYFRDFSQNRLIIGVHEAAYVALSAILKTAFVKRFERFHQMYSQGMEGRQEIAAKIRKYLGFNPIRKILYRLKHKV
jgi:hypothetical protein